MVINKVWAVMPGVDNILLNNYTLALVWFGRLSLASRSTNSSPLRFQKGRTPEYMIKTDARYNRMLDRTGCRSDGSRKAETIEEKEIA